MGEERWTKLSAPDLGIADGGWVGNALVLWDVGSLEGYSYDTETESWRSMAPIPVSFASARQPTGIAAKRFFVWNHAAGAAYDPATDTWSPVAPMGGQATPDVAEILRPAVGSATRLFYLSNEVSPPTFPTATRMMYHAAEDTWQMLPEESAPTALAPLIASANEQLLVWGGWDVASQQRSNAGARFDPAINTWMPMTTVNAPPPMVMPDMANAWTGQKLFVWGSAAPYTQPEGGLYDPARDVWKPVTLVGAPVEVPRLAVWTNKHVIVVGYHSVSYGIYDPVSDAWYPMMPAPTEAGWHVAVWDGCRVLLQSAVGVYAYEPPPGL